MLWYTQIPVHGSFWRDLLPGYLLVGFALPFTFIPVSIAALAGVEHHEAGLASGLFNTAAADRRRDRRRRRLVGLDQPLQPPDRGAGPPSSRRRSRPARSGRSGSCVGRLDRRARRRRSCSSAATSSHGDEEHAGDGSATPAIASRRWRASTRPFSTSSGRRRSSGSPRLSRDVPATAPREARVPEPGRLGQGPDRARDDRGGRARREAEARRHDRRADLGQHRRRPRDRGGEQGLPLHLRHARQDEPGEDRDAARATAPRS